MKKREAAPKDFTADDLPHNRVEVFKDRLRFHWRLLLLLGVILALGSLPFLAVLIYKDLRFASLYASYSDGTIDQASYEGALRSASNFAHLLYLPCLALLGLLASGVCRIIRQLVWGEGIFFAEDFRDGIKSSGLGFALVFFLGGAIYALDAFAYDAGLGLPLLQVLPFGFSIAFFFPVALFYLSHLVIYKAKTKDAIRNSFILFFKNIGIAYLGTLLYLGPLFLYEIPNFYAHILVFLLLPLLYDPLVLLLWSLLSNSVFDRLINQTSFPGLVDRGLCRSKKGEAK
jgi:hypothetical protein